MHPLLVNFSIFTWMKLLETEEKAISLLQGVELIPRHKFLLFQSNCILK